MVIFPLVVIEYKHLITRFALNVNDKCNWTTTCFFKIVQKYVFKQMTFSSQLNVKIVGWKGSSCPSNLYISCLGRYEGGICKQDTPRLAKHTWNAIIMYWHIRWNGVLIMHCPFAYIKVGSLIKSSNSQIRYNASMSWCKKNVTPLLTHWSYVFLAPTHRYFLTIFISFANSLCKWGFYVEP